MNCQQLKRVFAKIVPENKTRLSLTWTFISKWRFIPYLLCTRFLPDSWLYLSPYDVHSREDLNLQATDCRDECDMPIFLEEDIMRDVSYRAIPFYVFLMTTFLCYFSNDLVRTCSTVLLKLYLFILLPIVTIFLYVSVFILASAASSSWQSVLDTLGMFIAVTLSIAADVTILYQICIRKFTISSSLRTLLETKEGEDFSIMDVSKKISSQLKLFDNFTPQFTRYFDGKTENEVFQQYSGHGPHEMFHLYRIPDYMERYLNSAYS